MEQGYLKLGVLLKNLQKRNMSGKSFQEMLDTVLVVMAARGDARKVAELLSQGARVDARDRGFTPLMAAAVKGS